MTEQQSVKSVSNKLFSEQIGEAMKTLGVAETASCMARALIYTAAIDGKEVEFDCDLGTLTIQLKELPRNS